MKHSLICVLFLSATVGTSAQATQADQDIAARIAQRIKDTLGLANGQKDQLYTVNLQLAVRKRQIWAQTTILDTVRVRVQRVENTRDSLYQPILSAAEFEAYRQKKRNLVHNN